MLSNIFSYFIMGVGFLIIIMGIIIWKKQKISLIHLNCKTDIKKEDVKDYTEAIGKAYIILGSSVLLFIILGLTDNDICYNIGLILWMLGFVLSIVKQIRTQKKYKIGIWN